MARKKGGPSPEFIARLQDSARLQEGYPSELRARLAELAGEADEGRMSAEARSEVKDIRSTVKGLRKEYLKHCRPQVPGRLLSDATNGTPALPGPFWGPPRFDTTLQTVDALSTPWGRPPHPRDFELQISFSADNIWGAGQPGDPAGGVAGWSEDGTGIARITNLNGKGVMQGVLNLVWLGTIPGDGRYSLSPTIVLRHDGTCYTQGDPGIIGVDAEASATVSSILTLDSTVLTLSNPITLAYAESRRHFDDDLSRIPGETILRSDWINFDARAGQILQLLVYLVGHTWTRGRADAEIEVTRFGVCSNVLEDTVIPVYSGLTMV